MQYGIANIMEYKITKGILKPCRRIFFPWIHFKLFSRTIPPPFWVYYSILWGEVQEVKQNPFARSATSLTRSVTSLRSTSFAVGNIVHLCPPAAEWCWADAQMMLRVPRKWCCVAVRFANCADTNEKILKASLSGFFETCWQKRCLCIFINRVRRGLRKQNK